MSDLKSDMVSAMKEMVPNQSPEADKYGTSTRTSINTIPKERMFELVQEVFSKTKEYVEEFIMTGLSLSDTEKAQLLAVLRNIYLLNERKDQPCDS